VKALLKSKAAVDSTDEDGTSALMAAAAGGFAECVTALTEAGADPNKQNSDGHSPLMFAYNSKNQVHPISA
jgi:ankyrin repeat protein